ncbi:hypothetical protein PMAYCL1PPCAC_26174, partial [Pristionchus mayeri]
HDFSCVLHGSLVRNCSLFLEQNISSIACISVLTLMIKKPPKNLGKYRFCYYLLTSIECVSSIAHHFGAPARDSCFYVDDDRLFTFVLHDSTISHITWILAHHTFEVMLTACFLYRYASVCRNKYLMPILNSAKLFAMTLGSLVGNIIFMTVVFYLFYIPTEGLKKKAAQVFFDKFAFNISEQFIAGYDYEIGNPYIPDAVVRISHIASTILSIGFIVIMTVCAFQIYNYVKRNAFSSSQTRLHIRVLMLLTQQTIVPFFLVYSLALCCTVSILIRADISFMAPVFTLTTSIPPLCSCISIITMTLEYTNMFNPLSKYLINQREG